VFRNIPDKFQDTSDEEVMQKKDLERSRFEGFELSSESKNNVRKLQEELLGVYTNRLRPDIFIKKGDKVSTIKEEVGDFLNGICYVSGWHVPVIICNSEVKGLEEEMTKFQNDYIMYLPDQKSTKSNVRPIIGNAVSGAASGP
jgi:hypothetical protein